MSSKFNSSSGGKLELDDEERRDAAQEERRVILDEFQGSGELCPQSLINVFLFSRIYIVLFLFLLSLPSPRLLGVLSPPRPDPAPRPPLLSRVEFLLLFWE